MSELEEDRGEGGGLVSDLPSLYTVTRTNSVFDTRCFVRVFIQSVRTTSVHSSNNCLSVWEGKEVWRVLAGIPGQFLQL